MSGTASTSKGEYSVLQKIKVTCETCGVSDSFYSSQSVKQFKSRHAGHDVVGGGEREAHRGAHEANEINAVNAVNDAKPPQQEAKLQERKAGTGLTKVLVDMVDFPALLNPVFRVRGFKDNLEDAFVTTSPFEESAKVRELLLSGEYDDYNFSGAHFFWDADAIECEKDVREKLGLPAQIVKTTRTAEHRREPQERPEDIDQDTVARTNEILFSVPPSEETAQSMEEPLPAPSHTPTTHDKFQIQAPPSPTRPAQEQPSEPEPVKEALPRAHVRVQPEQKREAEAAAEKQAARPEEEEGDDNLLVSKSWYIQGGTGNKREAVRISKVLKGFRWKVEPVYTIGVILDDMLSIETSKNEISRTLIKEIEDAGYRLTAVITDQGRPIAWFKKSAPEKPSPPGSTDAPREEREREDREDGLAPRRRAASENGTDEPVASSLDDLEAEIEPHASD